mgnify:CR=1 FL=1
MSKGSNRRPQLVSDEQVTDNWALAFRKYRCGHCGKPCTREGGELFLVSYEGYEEADKVNGQCCLGKQYE